jgi:hypothetical protein
MGSTWQSAAESLRAAIGEGGNLCRPFVEAFPVSGAAISTIGGPLSPATICASDATARRLDEVQIDLGEGPCWDAVARNSSIAAPDLAAPDETRWPAFRDAIHSSDIAAVFAFPLRIGQLRVGVVDLYSDRRGALAQTELRDAGNLAGLAAHEVFRRALKVAGAIDNPDEDDDGLSRAIVHQATGMIIAQLDIAPDDAILVLKGRAFSTGRSMREIARDIVERRLDFSQPEDES